jgi:hypothetical protein
MTDSHFRNKPDADKAPPNGYHAYLIMADSPDEWGLRTDIPTLPTFTQFVLPLHGIPLYAGSSMRLSARLRQHRAAAAWWPEAAWLRFFPVRDRDAMLRTERFLISHFRPMHNTLVPKHDADYYWDVFSGHRWRGSCMRLGERAEKAA